MHPRHHPSRAPTHESLRRPFRDLFFRTFLPRSRPPLRMRSRGYGPGFARTVRRMCCPALRPAAVTLLACIAIAVASVAHGGPQPDWPRVALPPGASSHEIGDEVSLYGMPLRIAVFTSPEKPSALVQWFGKSLGEPFTLDTLNGKTILGRRQAGHYITLQLEAAGSGARGLIAVSDLAGFLRSPTQRGEADARWDTRLPADTQVVSRMRSRDGNRRSDYVVARNRHSGQMNVDALTTSLAVDGLVLERDVVPGRAAASGVESASRHAALSSIDHAVQPGAESGRTLFFRGRDKEAMAVIARDAQGNTVLAISLVTTLEPTR
jgi:hypothetical protein